MAFIGQTSAHACLPPGPPVSLQKGVFAHRSHFWACFSVVFHRARDGVNGQAFTQRSQPMHLAASMVRTLPLAASTWLAPVGHASTHAGYGHWRHWEIWMSFGYFSNGFCMTWILELDRLVEP